MNETQQRDLVRSAQQAAQRRAEYKLRLKHTETDVRALLEAVNSYPGLPQMRVQTFLESLPAMGPKKAAAFMRELEFDDRKRLGSLRRHEKERLLLALGC